MCSFMENKTLGMNMTVAADVGFGRAVSGGSSVKHDKVHQTMISYLNVANVLYEDMLGVYLRLSHVLIMTSDGTYNWNSAPSDPGEPSCGYSEPNDLLLDFEQWRIDTYSDYPSGLAHLLTDCFPPPGTVGLGYTSVTCHNSYGVGWSSFTAGTTWSTVAHEIGHNFGGQHAMGTEGIMSYSSTPDLEFKGDNIDSICKELDLAVHAPWSCFESARSKCKNGVVEPGEQCDDNSGCCSDECTYTDQCTHEDNKCCTGSCTFQPGTHSCGFGKRYCTAGRCAADSVCESYSNLVPCTPSASHDDGCVQLCRERDSNTCYPAHWFGDAINATQARVQDGTVCSVSPVKTCQKGDCVAQ